MWNIASTTELLRAMSASAEAEDLLRLIFEHIRRSVHVERAVVLSGAGLTAPRFRVVQRITQDSIQAEMPAESQEIREGGILSELLNAGRFESIPELTPDPSDPSFDLLRDMRSLMAFPLFEHGVGSGMVVMLGPLPQTCNATDLCGLAMMSALLDRAMQAHALAHRLESTCRALDFELQSAANVQRWLLPPSTPVVAGSNVAASYRTSRHSGGDYYDIKAMPDGRLGLLIADVSGKGAAAAVLMAVLRTIVHESAWSRVTGPAELLNYADRRLCDLGLPERGTFVTAFACALNPTTGDLTYSSAGHNPPRLLRARTDCFVSGGCQHDTAGDA